MRLHQSVCVKLWFLGFPDIWAPHPIEVFSSPLFKMRQNLSGKLVQHIPSSWDITTTGFFLSAFATSQQPCSALLSFFTGSGCDWMPWIQQALKSTVTWLDWCVWRICAYLEGAVLEWAYFFPPLPASVLWYHMLRLQEGKVSLLLPPAQLCAQHQQWCPEGMRPPWFSGSMVPIPEGPCAPHSPLCTSIPKGCFPAQNGRLIFTTTER